MSSLSRGTESTRGTSTADGQITIALAGNPNLSFERYDAGHAFSNDHRPGFYDQAASDAAYARTFEVFDGLK